MPDDLNPESAEMAVLHAAFGDTQWLRVLHLREADFYDPRRGALWRCLAELDARGVQPDPQTVIEHLHLSGHHAQQMSTLLVDVVTDPSIPSNAERHAQTVTDRATRRALLSGIDGARERLSDVSIPVDAAVAFVEQKLIGSASGQDREADQLWTYAEFVSQDLPPVEWVIPNLLAREDRLVLTGTEGAGKTTLQRTIAVMAASGLHPFTLQSMEPRRVLVVDLENPNRIMVKRFAELGAIAERRGHHPKLLNIRRVPQGIDLSRADHRMRLRYLCQATQPELLVIGPAYKMVRTHPGEGFEESVAHIAEALDDLREEFGFALLLEHHIPKGEAGKDRGVAPIGSSFWLRWPEFGIGLKLDPNSTFNDRRADLVHWRGARDERPWPKRLESGGPNSLPWIDRNSLAA